MLLKNKPSNTNTNNKYWGVTVLYPKSYNKFKLTIFMDLSDCCGAWTSKSWGVTIVMVPLFEVLFH